MPKPSTPAHRSRRRVLTGLAGIGIAASLAGCTALWDQAGATDVTLRNVADERLTVSVTVTGEGDADPHTDRTLDLGPHEYVDQVNDGKIPMTSDYTVTVSVAGGPSETFEWEQTDVELAPLQIVVGAADDNIDFLLQAG